MLLVQRLLRILETTAFKTKTTGGDFRPRTMNYNHNGGDKTLLKGMYNDWISQRLTDMLNLMF